MAQYKNTFKMLDVVAEKQDQIFEVFTHTLPTEAEKIVDSAVTPIFDQVIIFKNAAIIQGRFHKRIQFVDTDGYKRDFQEDIPFTKKVELPGLTPTITVGTANRATVSSNAIIIGPDGDGSNAGIDIQIYIKSVQHYEELSGTLPTTSVINKMDLNFLIKIAKYKQVAMNVTPPTVFEFRNVDPSR